MQTGLPFMLKAEVTLNSSNLLIIPKQSAQYNQQMGLLQYELDLEDELDILCPVRIIDGLNDTEVSPDQSKKVNSRFIRRGH